MTKTSDKVLLGVLFLALIGMSSVFISAGGLDELFGQADAERVALGVAPGQVQEVDVENEGGQVVYDVDVLTIDGQKEVTVNEQGQILSVENEEIDVPITGSALEQASVAALNYIGEGEVTDSEVGDEEGYYEIEITLDNGDEVDVHLNKNFNVLSTEYD